MFDLSQIRWVNTEKLRLDHPDHPAFLKAEEPPETGR